MIFYDVDDLAELLKTDIPSVLAMSMAGEIPEPHFIGRRIVRWSEFDIDVWAENGCESSAPTLNEHEWLNLRQANRREFFEKYLAAEEQKKRIALAVRAEAADTRTDADALADCQCNSKD